LNNWNAVEKRFIIQGDTNLHNYLQKLQNFKFKVVSNFFEIVEKRLQKTDF